jgi:hypothetical protein
LAKIAAKDSTVGGLLGEGEAETDTWFQMVEELEPKPTFRSLKIWLEIQMVAALEPKPNCRKIENIATDLDDGSTRTKTEFWTKFLIWK